MKNPPRKKSVQSGAFRRKHAVVHVSAIMHILPGYRGTYIWGGGGGMYFRGIAADNKFQEKMKGTYFQRGTYLRGFTVVHPVVHAAFAGSLPARFDY